MKVGIVGSTGYSGQELVDILLKHPGVKLTCLTARFDKPTMYSDVYPKFRSRTDIVCEDLDIEKVSAKADLVFMALPHTVSMDVVPGFLKKNKKIIDLSADYRLSVKEYESAYDKKHTDPDSLSKAVYGMPELNRDKIKEAKLVANPGCYPTSVILGLAPVIKEISKAGLGIIVDSKSGASGAGRKASVDLSFTEVDENFKCYKANEHQHIPEMERVLSICAGSAVKINFTPHLLPIRRGILSTIYVEHKGLPSQEKLHEAFLSRYEGEPFVRVMPAGKLPEVQSVAGTNYCDIGIKVARGMLIIVSVIDNLVKGASGQAVQNMNIMCGFDEKAGLV